MDGAQVALIPPEIQVRGQNPPVIITNPKILHPVWTASL